MITGRRASGSRDDRIARRLMPIGFVVFGSLLLAECTGLADDFNPSGALELLERHCVKCHSGEKPKGGLDIATRERLLKGGESGEPIGEFTDSNYLLRTIRHDVEPHMPFKAAKLSDAAIATLTDWAKAGFPYSRELKWEVTRNGGGFEITDADRGHWSFQPIRNVPPPTVDQDHFSENPIDRFVLAKLQQNGMTFSRRADRQTLIRRITLDLIGLPPTLDEIDDYLSDPSPDADERLVDRLLASPHYGERWGRHWLDLARYAETDGYEHDTVRPHSWRYRDYVIKSFNEDKPYDRFIREQLAGDELWPGEPDAVTATGFNLLGPDMVDSSDQVQRRHNTLNDMTDTMSLAFLGLTAGCARCHDHKLEPISQRDYYSIQAFFTPVKFDRERPIPTSEVQAAYDAAMREFTLHPKFKELADLESPVRERLFEHKVSQLSVEAQAAHRTPVDQRTSEQANLVLETLDKVKVSDKELMAALNDQERKDHSRLQEEIKKLPRPAPLPKAMALLDGDHRTKTFILHRGEYTQPGELVAAGFPSVLQPVVRSTSDKSEKHQASSRVDLADWLASPRNPLTSRVMVNRIWQHHFGRGLVPTPSDFGTHGQPPSHPELLDWLANEFIRREWSIKQMHRLFLLSATCRQVSNVEQSTQSASAKDPENRLYWRMNRVRLEGEVIRDSLLDVSGQLNPTMTGPGVFPPIPKELFAGSTGWSTTESMSEHSRRSIYIFARRNLRFPFLEVFDAPDSNLSCPVREGSTTAPQSLTLLNADEVTNAAKRTAIRVRESAQTVDDQVKLVFRLTLGREPAANEALMAREFLAESPLSEFCRAMFNLNEFVYAK